MGTKLLLADDSVTIQKVVGLTFAEEDVTIESVTDGNLAIDRVRETKPDIVLADIFMPGRNGYEVCAAIKADSRLADIPVVLLVGTFEPFDEEEAARVKCDAYLTKPFDTSELILLVHDLVEKRSTLTAATPFPPIEAKASAVEVGNPARAAATILVSERARASFLGENRILDLFEFAPPEPDAAAPAETEPAASLCVKEAGAGESAEEPQEAVPSQVIPFPGMRGPGSDRLPITLSEEMMDSIVEKVIKRMSQEVVREIAWEVVPELSEIMIRQYLDELRATGKK
jgi:CheY-like chemotaxis protein